MQNSKGLLLLLAVFLEVPGLLYSQQAPKIEWQKCLGGSARDWAYSIIQTREGGYALATFSGSGNGDVSGNHGQYDGWIVKLSPFGNVEWQKCLGGTSDDEAESIIQTYDGGFAVAGYLYSVDGNVPGNHGGSDAFIVKLDSLGNIEWKRCLGGRQDERANSIIQTFDSGFVIAGSTMSTDGNIYGNHGAEGSKDAFVMKLNSSGKTQWQKCYGGTGGEQINSIVETSDSGFAFAGYAGSSDGDVVGVHLSGGYWPDMWVVRLDSNGSILWQRCLGGSEDDEANSIINTNDGGFAVAGYTRSIDGDLSRIYTSNLNIDAWVIKFSSSGGVLWQKSYGGTADEFANSIIQTSDSGYVIAAMTGSNDGDVSGYHQNSNSQGNEYLDGWVVKLSSSGSVSWERCLGGDFDERLFSITQSSNGEFTVAGYTESNDGDVSGNHGGFDAWVVKLSVPSSVQGKYTSIENLSLSTYPNPTANIITLNYDLPKASAVGITIYNVTGIRMQEIQKSQEESGHHEAVLDLGGYADGTYFISVSACGMTERGMVQVLR